MEPLYVIAGLGNPGAEYAGTRHNAGFAVAERLAQRWGAAWRLERKFSARMAEARAGSRRCLLCAPQTYMNASGLAVGAVVGYYRLAHERLLVVVDDADLAVGQLRLRPDGSSGGHHGLESVESHLGTRLYPRLRLGIGRRQPDDRQITDYVLSRFGPEESAVFARVLDRAVEQVECWLQDGVEQAMNRFNGTVTAPGTGTKDD